MTETADLILYELDDLSDLLNFKLHRDVFHRG